MIRKKVHFGGTFGADTANRKGYIFGGAIGADKVIQRKLQFGGTVGTVIKKKKRYLLAVLFTVIKKR